MRIALAALLGLHGLIHLLGVLRPSPSGRALETLWFFALTVFVGAGLLVLLRHELWPEVAILGIIVSQGLIIERWHEAKAGTAVNLVLIALVVVGIATEKLHGRAEGEVRELLGQQARTARIVRVDDVARLPPPVRRWLDRSGVVGRPVAHSVRLVQHGDLRASPEGNWIPVDAVQHITTDEPGFVWWMEGRMGRLIPLAGRDKLVGGTGEMRVTAFGLVDVAFGVGPKIDEGALLRWLAEIVWVPSAAVAPDVRWEAGSSERATAFVQSRGVLATAVFRFDEEGRVAEITARRWYGADGPLVPWRARCTEWRRFDGVEVPVRGEIIWALPSGDFTFFRWTLDELETNGDRTAPPVDPLSLGRLARRDE